MIEGANEGASTEPLPSTPAGNPDAPEGRRSVSYAFHQSPQAQMNSNAWKTVVGVIGGAGFLVASIALATQARHYQVTGEPMPNGKGGFMTFHDGYYIAGVLLLMALAWFMAARRFARSSVPPNPDAPEKPKAQN